jgi:hypothetical protein
MDQKLVGNTTAELMDHLGEVYGEDETAKIAEVMVIVMVNTQNTPPGWEDSAKGFSMVHFRASDAIWSHQFGLLHGALRMFDGDRRGS